MVADLVAPTPPRRGDIAALGCLASTPLVFARPAADAKGDADGATLVDPQ